MLFLKSTVKVLICGGGNGAHVASGLFSSRPNVQVRLLSLFADEAERWRNISKTKEITVEVIQSDGPSKVIHSSPSLITNDPAQAVPGCNIILFCVPAFAHEEYFKAIAPYIEENTSIVGMPSQTGFEFQCINILGEKGKTCPIVSFESLPWACRILEFGTKVQILGIKKELGVSLIGRQCQYTESILDTLQYLIGDLPSFHLCDNYIVINLMAKSVIHPPIMYGKWKDYNNQPLDEKPLFYQGIDERSAELLSNVSDELMKTAAEIEKKIPGVKMNDLITIFDWYKVYYADNITDKSSLHMALKTNKAYDGLVHPMKTTEDGKFVPDFGYRYLSEDVPFGMCVFKGIAQLAGVQTPAIDEVIHWCQNIMNKEYLIGTELKGKDVSETRAPQRYQFKTLQDLFDFN